VLSSDKGSRGGGRLVVLGNRRVEGTIRKNQCYVEAHRKKSSNTTFVRPILNFDNFDIWQYIRENGLPYCPLYDEGVKANDKGYGKGKFKRLGCVLCPFSRAIELETTYFPKIINLWRLAADRVVVRMKAQNYITKRGKPMKRQFQTGQELYDWWISRK